MLSVNFLMLLVAAMSVTPAVGLAQGVIRVHADGPVTSVTDAVVRAQEGARIVVAPGTYVESGIRIDKSLTLIGEEGAVIEALDGEQIVTVFADGVTIEGLTFRGVSTSFVDDRSAIRIERAGDCRIADNRFEDTFFGVYLAKANGCAIERNVFVASKGSQTRSGNGIHLWYSEDVAIRDNVITGHRDGIYLEFSSRVTASDNQANKNLRYGLHFMFSNDCRYLDNEFVDNDAGVAVMYSKHVEMLDNRFIDNWGSSAFGLLLKDITDSRITGNTFRKNTVGIYAEGANRIDVLRNEFVENGRAIKIMANSIESVFKYNTFSANTFDVTTNSRQSFSTFERNYWDKYRGYDLDRNGVGDVPFYPVRLFSLIVERNEPAVILMRSVFVDLLDAAERVLPTLTPKAVVDEQPLIRPHAPVSGSSASIRAAAARKMNGGL